MKPREPRSYRLATHLLIGGTSLVGLFSLGCSDVAVEPRVYPTSYVARPPGSLTYHRDVAPILLSGCSTCHRPGGDAPFALLDYEQVREHGERIAEVSASRLMPPWLPAPGPASFVGERRLSDDEIGIVIQWYDEGAIEGDPAAAAAPPTAPDGWQLGRPDLVVDWPEPYELTAEGPEVFRYFRVPLPVQRRRYVEAMEILPGATAAIREATVLVDETVASKFQDEQDPEPGFNAMVVPRARRPDGHMFGWRPGRLPHDVPPEMAWPVDPGTELVVRLQLRPTGATEIIRPSIGLHFSSTPPTRTPFLLRLGSMAIDIAAGDHSHVVEDTFVLPVDVVVVALAPRAHRLCRRMELSAVSAEGDTRPLLRIDDWNFDLRDEYRFVEPVELPRGTELRLSYVYDNSADNPANPFSPPRRVVYGPDLTDAMGDMWLQVVLRVPEEMTILASEFARKEEEAFVASYEKILRANAESPYAPAFRWIPKHAAHTELGELLQASGRLDDAIEHFYAAVEAKPDYVAAHSRLGVALEQRGDADGAARHYARALQLQPDRAETHYNLGQTLLRQGLPVRAVEEFRRALELDPDLAPAHHALGNLLAAGGRLDEATAHFRRAVAIQPDYAEAHNNLGSALAATGKLDQATAHFRTAVESQPDYAPAQSNLGKALLAAGDYDQAILHLERSLEVRPEHPETAANLQRALRLRQAPR